MSSESVVSSAESLSAGAADLGMPQDPPGRGGLCLFA